MISGWVKQQQQNVYWLIFKVVRKNIGNELVFSEMSFKKWVKKISIKTNIALVTQWEMRMCKLWT